ncbi:alkaline phosphatase family protein [Desulfobaculum bizertense]|uniref:2,3-bisphosphoglycerate-independent phosphoglycerate mutase n=1 Tax=Desulfobaculum bizertense DSM 18034 TaxID=1121442 RepID=A0A1T4VJL2_9BACT|nr:alkaline phosphatase family protein [Desulfobaculum bizertense]SKA65164.1 2,3-bisphosphoglycerate-independent phosphoglycerate mutase [Desulfobaculum bizertense DSM 18034]
MKKPQVLVLIADGMGDSPVHCPWNITPLAAAHTPNMDALASRCVASLVQTIPHGMIAGSDVANMSLFGYDPRQYHTGRGPIEAAASSLPVDPEDLIWRLNFVTLSNDSTPVMLDYAGGHPADCVAQQIFALLRSICPDGMELIPGFQYRHTLIQRGAAHSSLAAKHIREPHNIIGQSIQPDIEELEHSPELLHFFTEARKILSGQSLVPAINALWPWGQGKPLHLPSLQQQLGCSGTVISAVDLIKGLGKAARMDVPDIPGATATLATDYASKVRAAARAIKQGQDCVFVHIEAPDEAAHSGSFAQKQEAIAVFDQKIVGPLRHVAEAAGAAILVTCDHLTPLHTRKHAAQPVPCILHHQSATEHALTSFSELNVAAAMQQPLPGHQLLQHVLKRIRS